MAGFISEQEAEHLRQFQASLSPEEKRILKGYKMFMLNGKESTNDEERRQINLALQAFMAGYRYRKTEEERERTKPPYAPPSSKDVGGTL